MLRLLFLAALAGFSRASDVLEFTDDDFENKIGDHELILVEFFAPWWVYTFCAASRKYLLKLNALTGFVVNTWTNQRSPNVTELKLCEYLSGLLATT